MREGSPPPERSVSIFLGQYEYVPKFMRIRTGTTWVQFTESENYVFSQLAGRVDTIISREKLLNPSIGLNTEIKVGERLQRIRVILSEADIRLSIHTVYGKGVKLVIDP